MIGVHKSLEPMLIEEYSESFELIVVEVKVGRKVIRVITGYGPQENWTPDEIFPFYAALEEEIAKAELANRSIMISFDKNAKMGKEHISEDPHDISDNGKIIEGILERHALTVANGIQTKSRGVITRKRIIEGGKVEESAIDLVLLSKDLVEELESIVIDKEKNNCLESMTDTKKGTIVKQSDHNTIVSKFKLKWNKTIKKHREEHFNLKNKENQIKFNKITSQKILSKVVKKDGDAQSVTKRFLKRLNGVIYQSFTKIRIKDNSENKDEIVKLFDRRRFLRLKEDENSRKEVAEIETKLADKCAETNYNTIKNELKDIECEEGGFNIAKLWKLKKKLCPYKKDPPTAMLDPKGNPITSDKELEKHTIEHYKEVLKNRQMKPGWENF